MSRHELQDKTARSAASVAFIISEFTDVGTCLLAWIRVGNEHVKRRGLIVSSQTHHSTHGCCHHERQMFCPTARQLLGRSHESKGHGVLSGDFPWDRSEQWGADKQGWVGAHV